MALSNGGVRGSNFFLYVDLRSSGLTVHFSFLYIDSSSFTTLLNERLHSLSLVKCPPGYL